LVQREEAWAFCGPAQRLRPVPPLAVPNVTAHPSTVNGQCTNFILFDVAL